MQTQNAKPIGLVFGNDSKLLGRLKTRFGPDLDFKAATASDCDLLHRMANVRVAIVLWSHEAPALAHRIQTENPGIAVLVERHRRGFGSPIEKNGFAATFDRAERSEDIIHSVADTLALEDAAVPDVLPAGNCAKLNLEAFLCHLPQVAGAAADAERLHDGLLVAMLSAIRSNQGALFLLNEKSASYVVAASQNFPTSMKADSVRADSSLCRWLTNHAEVVIADGSPTLLHPLWHRSGCDLALPLVNGRELLGWFLVKVRGVITESISNLLRMVAFFVVESLQQNRRLCLLQKECSLLQEVCTKTTDAAVWIDRDGTLRILNPGEGILKWRGNGLNSHLSQLRSAAIKSAVKKVQCNNPDSPVHLEDSNLSAKVAGMKEGAVLLSLHRKPTRPAKSEATVWRRAVMLALTEDRLAALPGREFIGEIRDLISQAADSCVSLDGLVTVMESEKRLRVSVDSRITDARDLWTVPAHAGARALLTLSALLSQWATTERIDVTLSLDLRGKRLTLDFSKTLALIAEDTDPIVELAFLGCKEASLSFDTAAFGFRLSLPIKLNRAHALTKSKIEQGTMDVSQIDENVLQKASPAPRNGANGIHHGPPTTGARHRPAASTP